MDTPSADQLLNKIKELHTENTHLKDELIHCETSSGSFSGPQLGYVNQLCQYVSPQGSRLTDPRRNCDGTAAAHKTGSSSFIRSSPLLRESDTSSRDPPHSKREIRPVTVSFTNKQYLNILQSMGQSIHIFDSNGRIIYWNRMAEQLYGYSTSEALGRIGTNLIADPCNYDDATEIIQRNAMGETWTGQFPVRNKLGQRFIVMATNTPFFDDLGNFVGIISVGSDSQFFLPEPHQKFQPSGTNPSSSDDDEPYPPTSTTEQSKPDLAESQQPLQVVIASKISNLASKMTKKVRSKFRTGKNTTGQRDSRHGDRQYIDQGFSETVLSEHRKGASLSGNATPSRFGVNSKAAPAHGKKDPGKPFLDSGDEGQGKSRIHKNITSRAEPWISKMGIFWEWKGSEHDGSIVRNTHGVGPCLNFDEENAFGQQRSFDINRKPEIQDVENNQFVSEASGSSSSFSDINSTSSESSSGSIGSIVIRKTDSLDYDILWEDLTIAEKIGQGSCGSVYHGLWWGSDVAVKVFSKVGFSDDLLHTFKQEVSLMKRLRHPNVLLFMGAVSSPQQLCIVTEFLPRGSLYQLIHSNTTRLDWRRRVLMALDIARGMNYLHHCNPPIVHCDLKSSNLLVDKNLAVKVADFGISRLKYHTYLTTRSWKGTPQWMAPEILRNEPSDEKSDVYSFGVVLWELATQKIPWVNLNPMQVIVAVGFMDERIEIPKDMDPRWVSIIESCWCSEPKCRPTFEELLVKLKDLLRQYSIQAQATRLGQGDKITTLAPQI